MAGADGAARAGAQCPAIVNANGRRQDRIGHTAGARPGARDMTSSSTAWRPARGRRRTAMMADVAKLAGVSHQTVSRVDQRQPAGPPRDAASACSPPWADSTTAPTRRPVRWLPAAHARSAWSASTPRSTARPRRSSRSSARPTPRATSSWTVSLVCSIARRSSARSSACGCRGSTAMLVITPQKGAGEALVNLPADCRSSRSRPGPPNAVPFVAVDQFAGAVERDAAAARARARDRLAHRRAARLPRGPAARRRLALGARGGRREAPPVLVGDWSPRSGYRLGQQLAANGDVTAIFVANDQMALGALRALHEAAANPAGGQHRRLRRHPRGAVLHAAADHRAPGLRRDGAQQPAPAARAHAEHRRPAPARDHRPRAGRAPQHRAAAGAGRRRRTRG